MKKCCEDYLNEQFGGDADIVNEIYSEYVSSVTAKVADAEAALAAAQWEALDKIAHTIKGNALAAGDQETADTAIALRSTAKLQNAGESANLVAKIKDFAAAL